LNAAEYRFSAEVPVKAFREFAEFLQGSRSELTVENIGFLRLLGAEVGFRALLSECDSAAVAHAIGRGAAEGLCDLEERQLSFERQLLGGAGRTESLSPRRWSGRSIGSPRFANRSTAASANSAGPLRRSSSTGRGASIFSGPTTAVRMGRPA
jgi:hypothetical protein